MVLYFTEPYGLFSLALPMMALAVAVLTFEFVCAAAVLYGSGGLGDETMVRLPGKIGSDDGAAAVARQPPAILAQHVEHVGVPVAVETLAGKARILEAEA